jgi:hypothetical protein
MTKWVKNNDLEYLFMRKERSYQGLSPHITPHLPKPPKPLRRRIWRAVLTHPIFLKSSYNRSPSSFKFKKSSLFTLKEKIGDIKLVEIMYWSKNNINNLKEILGE